MLLFLLRHAYRIAGSYNNFHGRLHKLFYVLSDDRMGSSGRLAPGSLAQRQNPEQADTDEVQVIPMDVSQPAPVSSPVTPSTPATPRGGPSLGKRKAEAGQGPSGSKLRPR
jgi:hypothetical protein